MKTPRRNFLKAAVLAGAAAALPRPATAGIFGLFGDSSSARDGILAMPHGLPRLTRLLDSDWRFHLGDAAGAGEPGFDDHEWRALDLPHDWSIEAQFDQKYASATGYLPGGVGWYRKTFRSSLAGKRVSVIFDGVYHNSEVWINGHSLGQRPYGYISFSYNLTPYLTTDGKPNVLAVKVDHTDFADTRWYNGSGIYRHVWIVAADPVHIPTWGTFVTTPDVSGDSATVAVETRVRNDGTAAAEAVLTSIIEDDRGKEVAKITAAQAINPGEQFRFQQKAPVLKPRLWSPDTPHLYSLVSRVQVGKVVTDEYRTSFGIRTFSFDPDQGFHLNGRKTLLKGVCLHHDGGCVGAAVPVRVWERRLEMLKEMGCNAIRTSHNPPAPELLDLCDHMGFLVMDEAFDEWARPKKKWIQGRNAGQPGTDGYAAHFKEWGIEDIKAMVERDKNHPSIILWSIGNELDYPGDPYLDPQERNYTPDKPSPAELPGIASNLVKAIKEIDVTRPVTAALANIAVSNRAGLAGVLDVVGYNYQEGNYRADHAAYPERRLIGSENKHDYAAWKAVEELPYANGQFLWTGIDYLGESPGWPARASADGLIDECGFKKPAFYFRQSLWSAKPMVYIAAQPPPQPNGGGRQGRSAPPASHWTWPLRDGDPINLVGYTNCEKVELWVGRYLLGEKSMASAADRVLSWQTRYFRGTLKAYGIINGKRVCSFELKTAGEPAHLALSPDLHKISADGQSVSQIEVSVVDADGNLVYGADKLINFDVSGPGRIIGIDSGDVRSHENFKTGPRKAYHGRCLVIVQSTGKSGTIRLTATAPGLPTGRVTIASKSV